MRETTALIRTSPEKSMHDPSPTPFSPLFSLTLPHIPHQAGPHQSTFRCLPITFPLFPMTTAVFQMVSPWAASRSRIGQMTTIPHLKFDCSR